MCVAELIPIRPRHFVSSFGNEIVVPICVFQDKSLTLELVMTLELLRNFMLHQPDVKAAAYESGLSDLLHRLWAWCQVEPTLMTAILHLLATYVANCSQGNTMLLLLRREHQYATDRVGLRL